MRNTTVKPNQRQVSAAYALAQNQASNARHGKEKRSQAALTPMGHVSPSTSAHTDCDHYTPDQREKQPTCDHIVDADEMVLCDPELGRLSTARRELSEFRLWSYAHKFDTSGSGRIEKITLYDRLNNLGIITSKRTFNDILARGRGLYWRERNGYLYLTGWMKLARRLTKWQAKYQPDTVETNRPGMQRVSVDLSGSLQQCHANLYAAWVSVKSRKLGYLEISRWTLSRLWNKSTAALIRYEKMTGIQVEQRYAESYYINDPLIPAYAYPCIDENGETFVTWKLSNRLIPPATTIHAHNGQRRKVRAVCNSVVPSTTPATKRTGGVCRLRRTGKMNFTGKQTKKGFRSAYKQIDDHLRKHHDIFTQLHYAYSASRFGKHIYQHSLGQGDRPPAVRRDWLAEQSPVFRAWSMRYRIDWLHRGDKSYSL